MPVGLCTARAKAGAVLVVNWWKSSRLLYWYW